MNSFSVLLDLKLFLSCSLNKFMTCSALRWKNETLLVFVLCAALAFTLMKQHSVRTVHVGSVTEMLLLQLLRKSDSLFKHEIDMITFT